MLEAAYASSNHGEAFRVINNERTILRKIIKFTNLSRENLQDIPVEISEDLETNFNTRAFPRFIESISIGADPDNAILGLSWELCARAA